MSAKQAPVTLSPEQLNDTDRALLDLLGQGRITPRYAADELDMSRPYASERLKRLLEHEHVSRLASGLYQVESDPRAEPGDEKSNVDTRDVVDDWLWEHHGFGVDALEDLEPEQARDALAEARIHLDNLNRDELGEALDELAEALGAEDDA